MTTINELQARYDRLRVTQAAAIRRWDDAMDGSARKRRARRDMEVINEQIRQLEDRIDTFCPHCGDGPCTDAGREFGTHER